MYCPHRTDPSPTGATAYLVVYVRRDDAHRGVLSNPRAAAHAPETS